MPIHLNRFWGNSWRVAVIALFRSSRDPRRSILSCSPYTFSYIPAICLTDFRSPRTSVMSCVSRLPRSGPGVGCALAIQETHGARVSSDLGGKCRCIFVGCYIELLVSCPPVLVQLVLRAEVPAEGAEHDLHESSIQDVNGLDLPLLFLILEIFLDVLHRIFLWMLPKLQGPEV